MILLVGCDWVYDFRGWCTYPMLLSVCLTGLFMGLNRDPKSDYGVHPSIIGVLVDLSSSPSFPLCLNLSSIFTFESGSHCTKSLCIVFFLLSRLHTCVFSPLYLPLFAVVPS